MSNETAAAVALVRADGHPQVCVADRLEQAGSTRAILEEEHGLLACQLLEAAAAAIEQWTVRGIRVITLLDADYPANLRAVHDRPLVLFVRGRLEPGDIRAVAVIGSRQASSAGLARAETVVEQLVEAGYTIVSGLAAGIDTAAHKVALQREARTIAVIGTGLEHAYPPQNSGLQRMIAEKGAVVSQFPPDLGPNRRNFPLRNAVMSGMALATVIIEATHTSGVRTQAKAALAHGRPVLLARELLSQRWAGELSGRPGVHVIRSRSEVTEALARVLDTDALVA